MEPTDENLRAWDALHRGRAAPVAERGLPESLRERLRGIAGTRVLHLFCGTGAATAELAGLGALVTAVDDSEQALEVARTRGVDLPWIHSDPLALPPTLLFERFDLVVCGDALARVRDVDALAASAAAALRPRGELILWDEHPVAAALDAFGRWRADYFAGPTLGRVVTAVAAAGLAVLRLEEQPEDDERIPGLFVLVAEKP